MSPTSCTPRVSPVKGFVRLVESGLIAGKIGGSMPGMRWWTADLHLGHANIFAYTGRPYHSPDEMNIDLIERWNVSIR